MFTLAAKYKMKIPREFTLVAKCLGTAQGVVEELDPSINILEIAEKTVRNLLKNRYKTEEFKNEVQTYALDWIDFMKGIPSSLVTFMHKLKKKDVYKRQRTERAFFITVRVLFRIREMVYDHSLWHHDLMDYFPAARKRYIRKIEKCKIDCARAG